MKKAFYLFTLMGLIISLSAFSSFNLNEKIKDGSYKASISKKNKPDGKGFSGPNGYEQEVTVKIEKGVIKEISPIRHNKTSDKLLNEEFKINNEGDFVATVSNFEQEITNKNDQGWVYDYKLVIKKQEVK